MKRSTLPRKITLFITLFVCFGFVLGLIWSNDSPPKKSSPTLDSPVKPAVAPLIQAAPAEQEIESAQPALPVPSDDAPADDADTELTPSNLPLKLPGAPRVGIWRDARIRELESKNEKFPTFAVYEQLAAHHLELGNTGEAARIFRVEAALYRKEGLDDAAQILENRAAQNESVARVFVQRPDAPNAPARFTGAPLEPRQGTYIGAFIDRDDALQVPFSGDNFQTHRFPSEFEQRTGRRLSSVFTYVKWGNFPRKWLQMCKEQGVIPQIAWEPDDLNAVKDDAYLRDCEQFLRDLQWPVWVRFAGEMNGDWTPYHGNPALYKQKFALVHRALHAGNARVATIWCVNAIPLGNINDYYPGDANCDWVGVNLYSAPFADNDRSREAFRQSPLELLDPIYQQYSARKPIAICEYAASHQSKVDMLMRPDFAVEKMSLLYGALPLLYPRVKMISWFDANNLIHAEPGRQLNNYRLTELPAIQTAFRELTASAFYLKTFPPTPTQAPMLRELKPNETLRAGERLWLWTMSADARPRVYVQVGDKVIYGGRRYGKHVLDLPAKAGKTVISVYDGGGRCVLRREVD